MTKKKTKNEFSTEELKLIVDSLEYYKIHGIPFKSDQFGICESIITSCLTKLNCHEEVSL